MSFSKEERIAQLKACAKDICDSAERIITDDPYSCNWKVTIEIECNKVPSIVCQREFVGKEILKCLSE